MVWMCHIHSPPEGCLDCFQFGEITNKASINSSHKGFCVIVNLILELHNKCEFNLMRNCQTVFHFLRAVVTNCPKLGGLKQQKWIISQFWSLEVWNWLAGPYSFWRLYGRILLYLFLDLMVPGGPGHALAFSYITSISVLVLPTIFFSHVSFCVLSSFFRDTSHWI